MAEQKPADTRIEGEADEAAINGMTPAIETIEAFAREIALMAWQALVRANQHTEKLGKANSMEEAAPIQADFLKESMEDAVPTHKKVHQNAGDLPARAGATGKRGGRHGRGRQARHRGEGRAPFRSCL